MNQIEKRGSWPEADLLESTADPSVSVSVLAEEVPTLTMATIIGVSLLMLIAIAIVFVLGVLIDRRQQRLIEQKIVEAKRHKNPRRGHTHPQSDSLSIANNMEETGQSVPPAEALRHIP